MTPLTGTDKQTAWAEAIRTDVAAQVEKLKAALTAAAARKPGQDRVLAAALPAIDAALADMQATHTTAKWWIDHQWDAVVMAKKAGSAAAHAAGLSCLR
jgi:hypothetical protein